MPKISGGLRPKFSQVEVATEHKVRVQRRYTLRSLEKIGAYPIRSTTINLEHNFMKMKKLFFIVILNLVLFTKTYGQGITELDYQLYSLVLNEKYSINKDSTDRRTYFGKWKRIEVKEIVLRRNTDVTGIGPAHNAVKSISRETIENYWERNSKSFELKSINSDIKLTLFDSLDNSKQISIRKFWRLFYKKYPESNGIVELSMIGYNREKTQALMCIGVNSNYLMGEGFFVFFELVNGKWKIKERVKAWDS